MLHSALTQQMRMHQTGQTGRRIVGYLLRGTTLIPSLWKYYHRHGYWARRKLNLNFAKYQRHHYHEATGPGKRSWSYYTQFMGPGKDPRYYKPLKSYCRF
jgi:hypothetical protein